MSNRTLVISIVVILLAFAGVVGFMRYRAADVDERRVEESKNVELSPLGQESSRQAQAPSNGASGQAENPGQQQAGASCTRNFDNNKLTTSKVNIQNRTVEIDVKDFGKIQLALYDKDAPKAVESFLRLVESGYYDCLTIHRVAKGFVIQGGDPNGNGTGGQSAFGKPFEDELNPNAASYKAGYVKGVLAMANSGPNTNGSQFFIMLGDNELPHLYTIFGKVTSGLEVVDKIGQVEIIPQMGPTDGAPATPVLMQSVKIIK